jgi:hypothetical protein
MSTAPIQPSPANEDATFIQHALPGLEDGTYELDVSVRIDDESGKPVNTAPLERSYQLAVTGDRFRLANPGATIASVFPASNAAGEFDTVLAHVVFNAQTFPWSRSPTAALPEESANGGHDADVPTWLAVLVLSDDDVAAFPAGELVLDPVTSILGNLFPPNAYPGSDLGTNCSYFDEATSTEHWLEVDEQASDPVQTIDIPLELFAAIAPTLDDLKLSAHVRQVSVENKPLTAGATEPSDPLGTYSIVVGNRLPAPDATSHAYLVSLERLHGFLPATSDGGTLTNPKVDITKKLRLAVLAHWTFTTTGGTATFVDALEHLNGRSHGADAANTNLRLSVANAGPVISGLLSAGYVPLNHELRTAETTVSWYRGPLSPIDAAAADLQLPIASPDEALVFDPTMGMFDASLAAAWTIGRLIALQDSTYAAALYAWKMAQKQKAVDAAERLVIDEIFGEMLELLPPSPTAPDGKPLLHDAIRVVREAGRAP